MKTKNHVRVIFHLFASRFELWHRGMRVISLGDITDINTHAKSCVSQFWGRTGPGRVEPRPLIASHSTAHGGRVCYSLGQ